MWIIFTQWAPAYSNLHFLFVRESELICVPSLHTERTTHTRDTPNCRLKKWEKNSYSLLKGRVEYTDLDQMLSDMHNLELLGIWAEFQTMNLGFSPVRIIRIFAIHMGIFSCFHSRHSFSHCGEYIILVSVEYCNSHSRKPFWSLQNLVTQPVSRKYGWTLQ